jgi:hypothetical protein
MYLVKSREQHAENAQNTEKKARENQSVFHGLESGGITGRAK